MIVYCDSSQLAAIEGTDVPNIIVVGGFGVRRHRHDDLRDQVRAIKEDHTDDLHVPFKWNIRDARDDIERHGDADFYRTVAGESGEMRSRMLRALRDASATVFTSIIRAYSDREQQLQDVGDRLPRWGFVNLLQRVGLCVDSNVAGTPDVQMVLDWPSSNQRAPWEAEYRAGWRDGDSANPDHEGKYLCGPLRDLGFRPGLWYASTAYTEGLQLADLVVGATRRFVQWTHLDQRPRTDDGVQEVADLLNYFHDRRAGIVVTRGMVVAPRDGALISDLQAGVRELRRE